MMQFELPSNTPLQPFDKHWQFCVGSGHAGLALRADYGRLLRQVREELGMERVRFHGIFGSGMHTMHTLRDILPLPGLKKFTEISFRHCGLAYDNVLAAGMKPFVELSFMPPQLARRQLRGAFFYKPNVNPPKDYDAWKRYIQSFVRFLQGRYGKEEIRSWFFEVWNEPDLPIAFFNGTQQEYFHLYEVTARAVKAIDPQIQVGGPATAGSKWIAAFMQYCKENNVPVDFVTTHQYAGDPIGGVRDKKPDEPKQGSLLGEFYHRFRSLKDAPRDAILPAYRRIMRDETEEKDLAWGTFPASAAIVQQQAEGKPVYYTEWNTSAIFSAYSNDTRKVAAYNVKACLALEGMLTGSSIWCFSDIFEELHPFPEEFHGGFGLLTQGGIKKPVYHGMRMLAEAGSERYVLPGALDGEIGMAAFRSETETQILLLRQNMKNLFDRPKKEACVSVALDQAPKRVYMQRIDGTHGNPLLLWEDMGSPQVPTPAQMEQLKSQSALPDEELAYEWQDSKITFTVSLGVNDLYFIRIERSNA